MLSSGVARIDPPAGAYPDAAERRKHQIAIQGLLAPTEQLEGALLSSSFPALNAPAVAIDIYSGDTGLDSGRPQSLYSLDPHLIDQHRLNRVKRVNLRVGDQVLLDKGPAAGTVVRFDGAVPFVNLQVSHDPGQIWVLVFAIDDDGRAGGVAAGAPSAGLGSVGDGNARYGECRGRRFGADRQRWLGRRVRTARREVAGRATRRLAGRAGRDRKEHPVNTTHVDIGLAPQLRLGVHLRGGDSGGRPVAAGRRTRLHPQPPSRT